MVDFAAVFDASPNPYVLIDRDLRCVAANRAYCDATHRTAEQVIGNVIVEEFPGAPEENGGNVRRLESSLRAVFDNGVADVIPLIRYPIEIDGHYEVLFWSATHTPLFGKDGRVEYVLQHTVNVTEVQRSRTTSLQVEAGILDRAHAGEARSAELDRNLRELLSVFDQAPGFLAVTRGPTHVVELTNPGFRKLMLGRDIVGKRAREALPEIAPRFIELLDRVYATGEPYVGTSSPVLQLPMEHTAEQLFIDFIYQPISAPDGTIHGVLVFGHDVTARVRAEQQLERAKAELEAIFENFPEALYVGDEGGIRRANWLAAELCGFSSVEELYRPTSEIFAMTKARDAETGRPLTDNDLSWRLVRNGKPLRRELLVRNLRTGKELHVLSSAAPIRTGGVVVTSIDITERRRLEQRALQLARVLDETRDFVGIADIDGKPTFVNDAARKMMGFDDDAAAKAIPFTDYFVEYQRARVRNEVVPIAMATGYWQGELAFVHQKTGEAIPVWYSIFPLRDEHGAITGLATITRDMRSQKVAEDERASLLEAERAARAQAERASLLMDQFLATVSHELRTPLTAILGWTQMLRSGALTPEKQERALATVERNAHMQAELVDDLLDVSRIITGKLAMEMEPTDLAATVAAALETVRPSAQAKGVEVSVEIEGTNTTVLGDSARLQQVVWNLLSNAVKFTPKGGHVWLQVARLDDELEVRVTDNGIGIPAEFLPNVFDRFRQADAGTTRRKGGLGLGLAIVRHVVEAHNGTVQCESDGKDKGSTFTVRFPTARRRAPRMQPEPTQNAPLDGMKILVVDDEEDTREFVRNLLEQNAATVTAVSSAADAMTSIEQERPDVLLTDLGMPEEDGYSLIRRVRALPTASRIPAVALTAYARTEDRTRAMLAGFQNHVPKPVVPSELLAVLASFRHN